MPQVNQKETFRHLVMYEKISLDKNEKFEECNMTIVNLEKILEYLKIQERLRSQNFTEYYLRVKEYFDMFFSTQRYFPQA